MSDAHGETEGQDTAVGDPAGSNPARTDEAQSRISALEFLPWQNASRERIEGAHVAGRMPHALLLHGPAGVGKEAFASALAAALCCTGRDVRLVACGRCAECLLMRAGSHPDLHRLRRAEDRRTISVDQVREVSERLAMTSMRRGWRIAIVAPAEAMTANAQNALLKTLEEPAAGTLLVLATARPSALLATLRSRCQRIELARPPAKLTRDWLERALGAPPPDALLELARGAPLRALALAPHVATLESGMHALLSDYLSGEQDVTVTAAGMLGEGLTVRIDWLEGWLGQIARHRLIGAATPFTVPGDAVLQCFGAAVNITALFRLVDRLREAKRLLDGPAAPQLLVESWLVELAGSVRSKGVAG